MLILYVYVEYRQGVYNVKTLNLKISKPPQINAYNSKDMLC